MLSAVFSFGLSAFWLYAYHMGWTMPQWVFLWFAGSYFVAGLGLLVGAVTK